MKYILLLIITILLTFNDTIAQEEIGHCGGVIIKNIEGPKPTVSESGSFTITATFDPSVTPAQQVVIQYAINEWNTILTSNGIMPSVWNLPIRFTPLSPGTLGQTPVVCSGGIPIAASIDFNSSVNFYVDSDPSTTETFANYDLLTVARHEIGHAVGWVNCSTPFTNEIQNQIFSPNKLNIAVENDNSHTDNSIHQDDLMNTSLLQGVRKEISLYPVVAAVAQAYKYETDGFRCVQSNAPSGGVGHIFEPLNSFKTTLDQIPADWTILVIPGSFNESAIVTRNNALKFILARGGSVTVDVN